jgi:hypothetical protein
MALDRRAFLVQVGSGFAGAAASSVAFAQPSVTASAPEHIRNPYERLSSRVTWLSGEVHTHVSKARGSSHRYEHGPDAAAVYLAAKSEKLDFVAMSVEVTDSNGGIEQFGDVSAEHTHGVIGIPAREIQNNLFGARRYFDEDGSEFLHVLTLEHSGARLSICAHPRFYEMVGGEAQTWTRMKAALLSPRPGGHLEGLGVSGIEIFNGYTLATLKRRGREHLYKDYDEACWDELLTQGRLCWGFAANDAFVEPGGYRTLSPFGRVFVAVEERSAAAILNALKAGRFYSSTGVTLEAPRVRILQDGRLRIGVRADQEVHWSAKAQRKTGGGNSVPDTLSVRATPEALFDIEPPWSYVRIQCESTADPWRRAWLQPIIDQRAFGPAEEL